MGIFDAALVIAGIGLAAPILLVALGELVSQRAGIINIGLEGMMIMGAFLGFVAAWGTSSIAVGVLVAAAGGMAMAAIMGLLSITVRADQIITGVGLNVLGLGITTFLFRASFDGAEQVILDRPPRVGVPLLADLPWIGTVLFRHQVLVYLAVLMVLAVWFTLYRTTAGLAIRAAGELPEAVESAGVGVRGMRWAGLLFAGCMAGIGGAFLSIGTVGLFLEGMTAGRGFLGLAAVIFGRWRPVGVALAALVFGLGDALQLRLQAQAAVPGEVWVAVVVGGLVMVLFAVPVLGRTVSPPRLLGGIALAALGGGLLLFGQTFRFPSQLWLAFPYVVTLTALAAVPGRARGPSALAQPYRRS